MWGVAKTTAESARVISEWSAAEQAWREGGAVLWLDIENPSEEELRRLDQLIDLDDEALEECLTGEPRPRIEHYDDYLLLIVYGVLAVDDRAGLESRRLAIFRGERFLVTIHTDPSRSVAAMKKRCEKNADAVLSQGVDRMLYRLVDGLVDRYLTLLDDYEDDLDRLEEVSFDAAADSDFLQTATRIRRHFIEVRRLAAAQRGLLEPLVEGDFDHLASGLGRRFRGVRSNLLHAIDRVDGLHERLNAAIQNHSASVAKRTNDVVRTLTVLTAVMLPMSLIAGVFGMNFTLWPPAESPLSFWGVLVAMGAVGGGMLLLFRRLGWI